MNVEQIGTLMIEWVAPLVIVLFIIIVFVKTRKQNIAYNAVGFLFIMLSVLMSGAPNFVESTSIANCQYYKLIALLAGLLGTTICAVVAFRDQAASDT